MIDVIERCQVDRPARRLRRSLDGLRSCRQRFASVPGQVVSGLVASLNETHTSADDCVRCLVGCRVALGSSPGSMWKRRTICARCLVGCRVAEDSSTGSVWKRRTICVRYLVRGCRVAVDSSTGSAWKRRTICGGCLGRLPGRQGFIDKIGVAAADDLRVVPVLVVPRGTLGTRPQYVGAAAGEGRSR